MTAKKVLFYVSLVLLVLGAFSEEATLLQALPLMAISGILIAEIWAKKNLQVLALVLSVIYLLINISIFSLPDILFWGAAIIVFLPTLNHMSVKGSGKRDENK